MFSEEITVKLNFKYFIENVANMTLGALCRRLRIGLHSATARHMKVISMSNPR